MRLTGTPESSAARSDSWMARSAYPNLILLIQWVVPITAGGVFNATMHGTGTHRVSLDQAIATLRQTWHDMRSEYKETSRGGLAVTGGKERMRFYVDQFRPEYVKPSHFDALVADLHKAIVAAVGADLPVVLVVDGAAEHDGNVPAATVGHGRN